MIQYFQKDSIFRIDTVSSSYVMGVVDNKYLGHVYYGKKISGENLGYLMRMHNWPFVPSKNEREKMNILDGMPSEYPTHGIGDFRNDAFCVETMDGYRSVELVYKGHEIVNGKPELPGLPSTFENDSQKAVTLKIFLKDDLLGVKVTLLYSVFEGLDAIIRSVLVDNEGEEAVYLRRVYSLSFDMDNDDNDRELITLHGAWARERHIQRSSINLGLQGVSSLRGVSSHQHHPFMGIVKKNVDYDNGEVIGINFVYSGNFKAQVYRAPSDVLRIQMGINDEDFGWKLEKDQSFTAPEVVMVYSDKGLNDMTHTFHDLYREHLIRSPYKDKKRPILINNWEATYFDFNEEKLIAIADQASRLGIEMLVMDDGWFGERNDDNKGLGDWFVNENKLKGGLKFLVDEVNKRGMKFGIWFEPEMVCPDSDLYRAHPDWAIAIPGRKATLSRNQYVLDITRKEVRDYVVEKVCDVLSSANIEYVKWDMNRALTDIGSLELSKDRIGEYYHRYCMAVYEMQGRVLQRFPELLLENCSSGGGRFDPGMLYYSPQIWCSDDTDAIERLAVHEGTALIYPLSTMGAHVSDCPNHALGRVTPFETRGYVALAGTFGYELDVTRIPEEDRNMIPMQCEMYHKYRDIITAGDYYRIASYDQNKYYDAYMVVSKDKKEALFTYIQVLNRVSYHSRMIRLKGLAPEKKYKLYLFNIETGKEEEYKKDILGDMEYTGDVLMNAGFEVDNLFGDFKGQLIHVVQI